MSLMTRFLLGVGLALVLLSCCVDAHGWMSYPSPRGQYASPKKFPYQEIAPASTSPDSLDFVCRNDPEMPRANWLPLTAGKSQTINLEITAKHVGDCFVYLTYDGDKPITEMKWFKIWEQHQCRDKDSYEISIPSYLPSGDHVIFRWEWYALHVHPTVEYYAQCVDATMTGSATGALPQPQVTMPGHLPKSTATGLEYWYPFGNQEMFFVGPPVATLGGQPNPTTAPTTAPTVRPTTAPTERPIVPTAAPTNAPTAAPTNPPPVAPTTRPTNPPPVAPTTRPSLGSVRLNTVGAITTWWFAATLSGDKASDIVSVQLSDGNKFSEEYEDCINEWANVWTFDPKSKGPLVYPLTLKATLSTGSSLSFSVNSPATLFVDSGSYFAA